jgi:ABC-2 type transport system permease protein
MDKIFLKCVTWLNPVLARMGVDTMQLGLILRLKLMIDNRRPKGMFARTSNKQIKEGKMQWLTTIMTLVIGVLIALVLVMNNAPYVTHTIYFLIFMVLMALTMISDFTSVLIDVRDHYILLPRPVNDRTIAVSRILHISIYVLRLALLQGLPALILIGFIDGPLAVPLFFVEILQATFLSILLVNMVYLLLMKLAGPQGFKDVISYFQIGFSIVIFAGYYLMPKLITRSSMGDISLLEHWWAYLLPPMWISALNELIIHPERSTSITGVLAVLGLILPMAGLWFVAMVLAPGFNRKLAVLATSDGNSDSQDNKTQTSRFNLIDKAANLLVKDPVENAGFRITLKLAARSRDFKMKVYPSLAYVPIYFLYFSINGDGRTLSDKFSSLQSGQSYVALIYLCTFVLAAVLTNITMSDKYKSSWVYYALPIGEPGKILSGMYKAVVSFYFFPYCIVIGVVTVAVWGFSAVNDLILAFLVSVIYGMLMALFMVKGLPFSKPVQVKQSGGRVTVSLLVMGVIAAIGYVHYFAMKWELLIWIMIIPLLIINVAMFHYYRKQTWENIELSEM